MALFNLSYLPKSEDKKCIFAMAEFLITASYRARREGILLLEDYVEEQKNSLLFSEYLSEKSATLIKRLLEYVVDGVDSYHISDIAVYSINSLCLQQVSEIEKLVLMMAAEGILCLQKGENPRYMCSVLAVMAGEPLGSELLAEYDNIIEKLNANQHNNANSDMAENNNGLQNRCNTYAAAVNENNSDECDEFKGISTVDELKDKIVEKADLFVTESADLRKILREKILEFADSEKLPELVGALGMYGMEKDTIEFFSDACRRLKKRMNTPGTFDFFISNDFPHDAVCSDSRLSACIELLDFDKLQAFEELLCKEGYEYLVGRIHNNALFFEDVLFFDDIAVQKIIRENQAIIPAAIAYSDDEVVSKILRNVSKNVREEIQDKIAKGFDKKLSFSCQKTIVKSMRRMINSGEIVVEKFL